MDEISRMEKILRGDPIEPVTRLEIFCAMAAGTWNGDPLTPVSRLEYFLSQISGGGGGGLTPSMYIWKPSEYSGEWHTSFPEYQDIEAPEGIGYTKLFLSDEEGSRLYFGGYYKHWYTAITTINANHFRSKTLVESIYLAAATSLTSQCFQGDSNLKNVIIATNGVATLGATNCFQSTPFASGGSGGTLWVPENQISAYQSASNWSTILGYANNQIKKIEGSVWE